MDVGHCHRVSGGDQVAAASHVAGEARGALRHLRHQVQRRTLERRILVVKFHFFGPKKPGCMGYGGHGFYGVGEREVVREGGGERGRERFDQAQHPAMLGEGDQDEWRLRGAGPPASPGPAPRPGAAWHAYIRRGMHKS